MTATLSASAAILKTLYPGGELPDENLKTNASWALTDRDTKFTGEDAVVAIQTEAAQGASADFDSALGSLKQGTYSRFKVTRTEYFGIARIKGQALKAAVKDTGALTNLWENEMKGISFTVTRMLAIHQYGTGTGSIGQIKPGVSVTATTVLLKPAIAGQPASDVQNFCVGMRVQGSATDGSALRSAGASATITGVDRVLGKLTLAVNWDTAIGAIEAGDFLYRTGDLNIVPTGYRGWIAGGPTPGTLFGLNRDPDPLRLAGQVMDATGMPVHEAIIELQARLSEQGGVPDEVFLHPRDIATFKKQVDAKVSYPRTDMKSKYADISFRGFEVEGDNGVLKVLGDINCRRGEMVMRQSDRWKIHSLGPAPQIFDFDENNFLRVANDDAYEVRVGAYLNNECNSPAYQGRATGLGGS